MNWMQLVVAAWPDAAKTFAPENETFLGMEIRAYFSQHGLTPPDNNEMCATVRYMAGPAYRQRYAPGLADIYKAVFAYRKDQRERVGRPDPGTHERIISDAKAALLRCQDSMAAWRIICDVCEQTKNHVLASDVENWCATERPDLQPRQAMSAFITAENAAGRGLDATKAKATAAMHVGTNRRRKALGGRPDAPEYGEEF